MFGQGKKRSEDVEGNTMEERRENKTGKFLYRCLECNYRFINYEEKEKPKCRNCHGENITLMIGRRRDDVESDRSKRQRNERYKR